MKEIVDAGGDTYAVYVTIDENEPIAILEKIKEPMSIYYRKGRVAAYTWQIDQKTVIRAFGPEYHLWLQNVDPEPS